MAEYITKEAAIEAFEWGDADVIEDYGDGCDFGFSRGAIKSGINSIPAADVAPVVHGRWSDAGFGELPKHAPYGWACSACGGISFNNEYIYCPNCGAKMDGERKDGGNG